MRAVVVVAVADVSCDTEPPPSLLEAMPSMFYSAILLSPAVQ